MHYYIDGYNLLFRGGAPGSSLQARREELIEELNRIAQRFSLAITVVFDAMHQPDESCRSHYKSLEIIFTSKKESADHYLLRLIEEDSFPSQITLVSSDRDLCWKAKLAGAQTQSVENFLQHTEEPRKGHRRLVQKKGQQPFKDLEKVLPKEKAEPPPKKPTPAPKTPQADDPYLKVFEDRYEASKEKLEDPTTEDKEAFLPGESEEQRWLRLFEERLRKGDRNGY